MKNPPNIVFGGSQGVKVLQIVVCRYTDADPKAPLPKGGCRRRRLGDIAAFGGMSPKGDRIPPALRATSL